MGDPEQNPAVRLGSSCEPPRIIERLVKRYSCPFCRKSRSSRRVVESHMSRCWKSPAAKSCGTCANHIPPEKSESADYFTGYPGHPGSPRSCEVDVANAEEMPRACLSWLPDGGHEPSTARTSGQKHDHPLPTPDDKEPSS